MLSSELELEQAIKVHVISRIDFDLETAKRTLHEVRLPGLPTNMSEEKSSIYFSFLETEDALTVRCLGALLSTLHGCA